MLIAACLHATTIHAQTPLSRSQAIQTALEHGARLNVARADVSIAEAAVVTARAFPNPTLNANYSKSIPTYHVNLDIPFDLPGRRSLGIQAARVGLEAARLTYQFNRAMIEMDADTIYTRAIAAREKFELSRRTAADADSLLRMIERRHELGDASEMDVEVARVEAGTQLNTASTDSIAMADAMFELQAALGDSTVAFVLTDSLTMLPEAPAPPANRSLDVIAAMRAVDAANLNVRFQHRSIWSQFSITAGGEWGDPDQKGFLPTAGLGIGLPFFDRNRGAIAQAEAERAKARAELALAELTMRNTLERARRERASAIARVERDRRITASANRVARMALTAYGEGTLSLLNVLEARRDAREVLKQYIDDLADVWVATAQLRVLSLTPGQNVP